MRGIETFYDVATMFTVNISSPNTPGLRDFQAPAALDDLIGRVMAARASKIAEGKPSVRSSSRSRRISPRTISRRSPTGSLRTRLTALPFPTPRFRVTALADMRRSEAGGLSGRPLFHRATVMLARVHEATGGKIPLIGIGGIDSPETALAKIEAGASLLQLYTGLIYEGPGLISEIKKGLTSAVRYAGAAQELSVQLRGRRAAEWAAKPRSLEPLGSLAGLLRMAATRAMAQIGTTTMAPSSRYCNTQSTAPKPEIVDRPQNLVDPVKEVAKIDAECAQHDADHDRDQRQPDQARQTGCHRRSVSRSIAKLLLFVSEPPDSTGSLEERPIPSCRCVTRTDVTRHRSAPQEKTAWRSAPATNARPPSAQPARAVAPANRCPHPSLAGLPPRAGNRGRISSRSSRKQRRGVPRC